jgi:acetyl-CoA C-acetyltransferase
VTIDPRTPVIVGVAQISHRLGADERPTDAPDPIDLMAAAVRDASVDTGADPDALLRRIDTIAVIGGLWRHKNPGAQIAAELELSQPVHSILTTFGGNLPIHSTHAIAQRIQSGEIDLAVVTGGECTLTRRALAKRGEEVPRREDIRPDEVETWGPPLDMGDRISLGRGGETPRNSYAILDSAIRAHRGETLDEARDRAARLWSGYAAVAAENPHAADRSNPSEAEIREPSERNRMVSWPYTKAMCANNTVDHAAAIIICSTARADELGVPLEQRVYPSLCVNSEDTPTMLDREEIHVAPGLRATASTLVDALGSVDVIDHIDLYSCFPSIVSLTAEELGIDPRRRLTVTGGLAFAGAPLNFAAGQALVGMVATLRADPGSIGVVQGNGGHATKHSFGVYSTVAPVIPHHVRDLGRQGPARPIADAARAGEATLRGVTVEFGHDGPERAIAVVEFDDGSRSWGVSDDAELMRLITEEETVGRRVHMAAGEMTLLT